MIVGLDTETHPIRPGMLAPRMVCLSWATRFNGNRDTGLLDRAGGVEWFRAKLKEDCTIVGHNLPFDLGVLCAEDHSLIEPVFDAYAAGRLRCTVVRQQLLDVALGQRKWRRFPDGRVERASYSLAELTKIYFDRELAKGADTWRLRYALLDGVPIADWPPEARAYAIGDAEAALELYEAQGKEIEESLGIEALPDEALQQRAAWALHLMSMYGVRADAANVDRFETNCRAEVEKMYRDLAGTGIFRADGSRDMKVIRGRVIASCARLGSPVPMTDPSGRFPDGQVQTDKDTLVETDDAELQVLATQMTYAKHLSQWGPVLRAAVDRVVCSRYGVLTETGRTSCSSSQGQEGSNWQNPPRKGDVRTCVRPREGFVFGWADADTVELRAHAQNCLDMLGYSRMAEYLVRQATEGGPDLHEVLAAGITGITPEAVQAGVRAGDEEMARVRQFAKIPGFGFPGGLGARTFVAYAAGQLERDEFLRWFGADREAAVEKAQRLRDVWFETFPENRDYFRLVGGMVDRETGEGTVVQLKSGRIRGRCRFTAAANGFFQGRVADAMKTALFNLARECYADEGSVLYGSRPNFFLHDEPGVEHPEATASARAERQAQIVVEALQEWMPDVPVSSQAVLTRRWYKGARPLRVDGCLVPVRPEKVVEDGRERVRWVQDA